jgi:restriction endonuclease S subunit
MKSYKLGELCIVSKGKTITRATATDGDVPVIGGGLGPTYFHNVPNIKPPVITISASGANAGFVNYWDVPIWASDCTTITESNNSLLLMGYIYKFLQSMQGHITSNLRRGSAQPHVYASDISDLIIPCPSLNDQQKMVNKLDEAFAEIELLEKNLDASEEKVSQLFQSLLSSSFAFSDDALKSVTDSESQGIAMQVVKLKDICTVFADGDWIESKDQSDSGIRLIQTGNVGKGVFKDRIEKARWISEETFKRLRCSEIGEGDVLISRLPDPVGRSCLLPALEHKAITAVDCSIVRFNKKLMNPKFFVYYSQSTSYSSSIMPLISGSTRQRISRENLGTIPIPVPSLERQSEIVEKLDNASKEIERMRNQIGVKREFSDFLRQSMLNDTFSPLKELVSK